MFSRVSEIFIADFFPDLETQIRYWGNQFDIELVTCHAEETKTVVGDYIVRNASLLPIQFAGIYLAYRGLRISNVNGNWSLAMFFFGMMNFVSLFCHNFLEKSHPLWGIFALLNIVSTGASCAGLIYAQFKFHPALSVTTFLMFLRLGYAYSYKSRNIPFLNEFIYIGMCLLAASIIFPMLIYGKMGYGKGFVTTMAGLGLGVVAVPLDAFACNVFGPYFSAVHMIFLSCDLMFLGFIQMLSTKPEKQKIQ